jgi:hypothetical protein
MNTAPDYCLVFRSVDEESVSRTSEFRSTSRISNPRFRGNSEKWPEDELKNCVTEAGQGHEIDSVQAIATSSATRPRVEKGIWGEIR